jgi:hypothetical protein
LTALGDAVNDFACPQLRGTMKSAFFTIFLLIASAHAQQTIVAAEHMKDVPNPQKFWTLESKIDFGIFAGQLAADAITTQYGLSHGMREANPLARPLVKEGTVGTAAASALAFGLGMGGAYCLHKTHHYKVERIFVRTLLAGEGAVVGHNIATLR